MHEKINKPIQPLNNFDHFKITQASMFKRIFKNDKISLPVMNI